MSTVVQRGEPGRRSIETVASEVVPDPTGCTGGIVIELERHDNNRYRVVIQSADTGYEPDIRPWQLLDLPPVLTRMLEAWRQEAKQRGFAGLDIEQAYLIAQHRGVSVSEALVELGVTA
ncbi:DNA topoisomerase VI subunit B [Rhodococcus sp. LBL1]|nr:DNA topoisomerase VI subunit B [Rhodococcus sp. LBL1]MDH6685010.1 DNA topoisomerase VI subunit B [Rhodococcus sp. LBL2]